jgi:RimJ/RimL family protein N-acetyltransferase
MAFREQLSDGVVRVRRVRPDDVDDLYEAAAESVAEVYPWMEWCHPGLVREETADFVLSRPQGWNDAVDYTMIIEDADTSRVLGTTGVNRIDRLHRSGNLGYWLRTSWTNRGYVTRSTMLTARFAFDDLDLKRVEIRAAMDNAPSRRVAEKVGAAFEGVQRNGLYLHGTPVDAAVYSLIPEDVARFAPPIP